MDKKNAVDASNSKGTAKMLQSLMKEEAELKKRIEAAKRHGEEQKASREKDFDQKLLCMLNDDFEGIGVEELKIYYDKLVEIKHKIDGLLN
ncbi:hypothetical protein BAE44_0010114 [Dichanthelium oligosanthes]|uniref:Uncharacterized protein n=1 Tax=Dichanthelium oligosanthes TaxID=888268 RepID=A0A1E5VUU6_9POAL|nr:hypothetical protein BAE44_0010114 [Dichanthelium oligosanthes]